MPCVKLSKFILRCFSKTAAYLSTINELSGSKLLIELGRRSLRHNMFAPHFFTCLQVLYELSHLCALNNNFSIDSADRLDIHRIKSYLQTDKVSISRHGVVQCMITHLHAVSLMESTYYVLQKLKMQVKC